MHIVIHIRKEMVADTHILDIFINNCVYHFNIHFPSQRICEQVCIKSDDDDDEIAYFTVRWKTRASFVYRTKNMR